MNTSNTPVENNPSGNKNWLADLRKTPHEKSRQVIDLSLLLGTLDSPQARVHLIKDVLKTGHGIEPTAIEQTLKACVHEEVVDTSLYQVVKFLSERNDLERIVRILDHAGVPHAAAKYALSADRRDLAGELLLRHAEDDPSRDDLWREAAKHLEKEGKWREAFKCHLQGEWFVEAAELAARNGDARLLGQRALLRELAPARSFGAAMARGSRPPRHKNPRKVVAGLLSGFGYNNEASSLLHTNENRKYCGKDTDYLLPKLPKRFYQRSLPLSALEQELGQFSRNLASITTRRSEHLVGNGLHIPEAEMRVEARIAGNKEYKAGASLAWILDTRGEKSAAIAAERGLWVWAKWFSEFSGHWGAAKISASRIPLPEAVELYQKIEDILGAEYMSKKNKKMASIASGVRESMA